MKLDQMPPELRAIKNWVLVKLVPRNDGNYDKVPVGIHKGQTYELAWSKPSNRSSFETVKELLQKELALNFYERRFHGVGFVLNDTDYMCVDLDKAFINDSLKPFAKDILASLHGFVEKSVSKTGLHIFIKKTWLGSWYQKGKVCRWLWN
jgi:primase-polymerase (primpol)-like protein